MVRGFVTSSFFHTICKRLQLQRNFSGCGCAGKDERLGIRYYSTHYETLGISKNAEGSEIKKAYIKKTKAHHPDKLNSNDGEKFLKIAEAYEVLSNPGTRREYDYKMFGMSSQYNRFESGEYNIPLHDSSERKLRYERMKQKKQTENPSGPSSDPITKMYLTPTERRILDYLMGVLISICIAMYLISRYQREHTNVKSDADNDNNDK